MKSTIPQVFIIESLKFSDENEDMFEGRRICDMLSLSGKECRYMYVRTRAEFEAVLEQFWDSKYRYLHLSCHAGEGGMDTTLDQIPFDELAQILEPYLEKRRLFLSACQMGSSVLAKKLIPKSGCFSILGPSEKVNMADAAIFWAAFYHKVFRLNSELVNFKTLITTATLLSSIFSINLNLFWPVKGVFKKHLIRSNPPPGKDGVQQWVFKNLSLPNR